MEPFFKFYIIFWCIVCAAGLILFIKNRKSTALSNPKYWAFLLTPWRLTTFAIACCFMILFAPYSGDPTWDQFVGFFMSVLTFCFAPWVTAVIYKGIRKELPWQQIYIAICIWMFSASWSYDAYNLIKFGYYPGTWLPNIGASSVLFISGGLFWNLDWIHGRGVTFAFLETRWPYINREGGFFKIAGYGSLFMTLVGVLMLYFFWPINNH